MRGGILTKLFPIDCNEFFIQISFCSVMIAQRVRNLYIFKVSLLKKATKNWKCSNFAIYNVMIKIQKQNLSAFHTAS